MSISLPQGWLLQGGRYVIERTLGHGGFGITYLAIQRGLERKVAIKEFYMKDLCDRDEESSQVTSGTRANREVIAMHLEKFIREAQKIAQLSHPNIVHVIDVFKENGTAYYVMEYASGGSLSQRLKSHGRLPEPLARHYILQIASALDYIHEHKMTHLDVKPANIMLNDKGEALLIDFGLAKHYDDKQGNPTSTTPTGISEGYAPMEQYSLHGLKGFSPETDIYSLGATFFKLLTGVTPPPATEIFENGLPMHLLEQYGVSQAAQLTIEMAMQPQKKHRLKGAEHFLAALESRQIMPRPLPRKEEVVEVLSVDVEEVAAPVLSAASTEILPETAAQNTAVSEDAAQDAVVQDAAAKETPIALPIEEKVVPLAADEGESSAIERESSAVERESSAVENIPSANESESSAEGQEDSLGPLPIEPQECASEPESPAAQPHLQEVPEDKQETDRQTTEHNTPVVPAQKDQLPPTALQPSSASEELQKAKATEDSPEEASPIGQVQEVQGREGSSVVPRVLVGMGVLAAIGIAVWYFGSKSSDELLATIAPAEVLAASCPDNHHPHMIDLGLPSGTKWSCCNLGASSPLDYGKYFCWGDTQDFENAGSGKFKDGIVGSNGELDARYDAASVQLGAQYHMPSQKQMNELFNGGATVVTWEEVNGIRGRLVKSRKNGSAIFLPASGNCSDRYCREKNAYGYYWTSTPYGSSQTKVNFFYFNSKKVGKDYNIPISGRSVRPVTD